MKTRQKNHSDMQLTQDLWSHGSCRRTAFVTFLHLGISFTSDLHNPGLGSTSFWNRSVKRRRLLPQANQRGARCRRHNLQSPPSKETCSAPVLVPSGACLLGICLTFSLGTVNSPVKDSHTEGGRKAQIGCIKVLLAIQRKELARSIPPSITTVSLSSITATINNIRNKPMIKTSNSSDYYPKLGYFTNGFFFKLAEGHSLVGHFSSAHQEKVETLLSPNESENQPV